MRERKVSISLGTSCVRYDTVLEFLSLIGDEIEFLMLLREPGRLVLRNMMEDFMFQSLFFSLEMIIAVGFKVDSECVV